MCSTQMIEIQQMNLAEIVAGKCNILYNELHARLGHKLGTTSDPNAAEICTIWYDVYTVMAMETFINGNSFHSDLNIISSETT